MAAELLGHRGQQNTKGRNELLWWLNITRRSVWLEYLVHKKKKGPEVPSERQQRPNHAKGHIRLKI